MHPDGTQTESAGVLYEFTEHLTEWKPGPPPTSKELLRRMRVRVQLYGTPLPGGYVPPPGIDLAALLREVPWPPPAAE